MFKPRWRRFAIDGVKALSIYDYDAIIKEKLYLLKGCGDYELAGIFLDRYIYFLKLTNRGRLIVPIPSWHEDDEKRGFNHVIAIFEKMEVPFVAALRKTRPHKQTTVSFEQRSEIKDVLALDNPLLVEGKDVLLVDDVVTSGSSMRAAIALLRKAKARSIAILVLSRTRPHEARADL